jgi:predicted lipoprotein with Yx(FWY)xxD motif
VEVNMNRSRTLSALVMSLLTGSTLLAAGMPCSIHPKKGAKKDELAAMAKISQEDAQKAALASLKDASKATVKEGELEAEHGCLIYSFDIAIQGKSGVQEVEVDAGNGKVLSNKHESAAAEAAEKAKDKAKPPNN